MLGQFLEPVRKQAQSKAVKRCKYFDRKQKTPRIRNFDKTLFIPQSDDETGSKHFASLTVRDTMCTLATRFQNIQLVQKQFSEKPKGRLIAKDSFRGSFSLTSPTNDCFSHQNVFKVGSYVTARAQASNTLKMNKSRPKTQDIMKVRGRQLRDYPVQEFTIGSDSEFRSKHISNTM